MDAIILTALLRTILTVTTVWNNVETGDIYIRSTSTGPARFKGRDSKASGMFLQKMQIDLSITTQIMLHSKKQ